MTSPSRVVAAAALLSVLGSVAAAAAAVSPVVLTAEELLLLEAMQSDPQVGAEYQADVAKVNAGDPGPKGDLEQARFTVKWLERLHGFADSYVAGSATAAAKPTVAEARQRVAWVAAIGDPAWNTQVFDQLLKTLDGAEIAFILARLQSMNNDPQNTYRIEITKQFSGATGFAPNAVAAVLTGKIRDDMRGILGQIKTGVVAQAQTAREQLDAVLANPDAGYDGDIPGGQTAPVPVPPGGQTPPPLPPSRHGQPRIPTTVPPPPPGSLPPSSGGLLAAAAPLIGAGLGAGLGFWIGGPVGAVLGLAAGAIGGMLLKSFL